MNLIVYRHLPIACSVMRGSLRLMPEGFGEFEVAEHARDGEEEEAVVWAVRNGLLDD